MFQSSNCAPYTVALSCRIFISLCLVFLFLFVVCVGVLQAWGRVEVCVVGK